MKTTLIIIFVFISLSNIYSQNRMSQDVHKFLTYQGVKLFKEKNPTVANTNSEFFNWLGGNAVSWEDWSNPLFNLANNDFPFMRGSMYVGALREDEEDVIDELCFPYSPGGITISHFWDADEVNGDNSPVPFSSLYNTENAYKKILKLWFGCYSEGIAVGHVLGQNSHWTMKVRFGPNGDGNLATAYNNIRNGNLNYLWVSKDKGYYGPCEEGMYYSDINVGFYTFCKNKWGWSDEYIIEKEKIIIFETLGRIIHLLGDVQVQKLL